MNTKLAGAIALAVLGLAGVSATAIAAAPNPATTTFQVTLTIEKACSVTATDLDFGTQDSTATNFTAATNGSVTVTCSKTTPYTIGLLPSATNGGTANGTGSMSGTIVGNTDLVAYTLYQNAAATTVWGNTIGTNTVGGTGTGVAQTAVSIYGKVVGANFTPDSYADTVTVNVAY